MVLEFHECLKLFMSEELESWLDLCIFFFPFVSKYDKISCENDGVLENTRQ